MEYVNSKDGTKIAFDRTGQGPAVIVVGGALADHTGGTPFAALIAPHFTVYTYDRRGRGESGDTAPYAVEREIQDLDALLDRAGGSAFVCGFSSGAALSLEAANQVPDKVKRLTLYECPFIVDNSHPPVRDDYAARLDTLISANRRGDALELFLGELIELPPEAIAGMRKEPMWAGMERVAPTLLYDATIMGDRMSGKPLPTDRWNAVTMPTLVMAGGASPDWMRHSAQALAGILPNAKYRTLEGQTHNVSPEVLARALVEFLKF